MPPPTAIHAKPSVLVIAKPVRTLAVAIRIQTHVDLIYMDFFIPCKFIKKKYAERLLDGEIYMRSLGSFGDPQKTTVDTHRQDLFEGAVASYCNPGKNAFLCGFNQCVQDSVKHAAFLAEDTKYLKLFCVYCLEYDQENHRYLPPDPQMGEFDADSVVIFRDYNEFLLRLCGALADRFQNLAIWVDRVQYFDPSKINGRLNPPFSKLLTFAYQKELRIAVMELTVDEKAQRFSRERNCIYRPVYVDSTLIMNIGSIRDIAYIVPKEQIMNLQGLDGVGHCPHNEGINKPSFYDFLVRKTREALQAQSFGTEKLLITIE